jgi:hypothetical protein
MNARQFFGRALYRFYYQPLEKIEACLSGGGPIEQRRTERGRREMEQAAEHLHPPASDSSLNPLVVHLLTGARFWYQTAFCLHTLGTQSRRSIAATLYDDGTLTAAHRDMLRSIFPGVSFVSREETEAKLDALLPRSRYPILRDRWDVYPNIRKLIDPHIGSSGWKLVLDSDLLFFNRPIFLESWLDSPALPLHAVDVQRSYGYSDTLLQSLATAPLADRLNVGLCGLRSDDLHWDHIEALCRQLIEAERTSYYLEQGLVAILLAGRSCAVAPADDYITFPVAPEAHACRAVMHHYVADSKRWYFQTNWRKCAFSARTT